VANPIKKYGYQGKGRTAMLVLKNEVGLWVYGGGGGGGLEDD
jgi:hypothetical protein